MMKVTIVSPERVLYKGEAESVTVPGTKGRFEVLQHHAPIISSLGQGEVHCKGNVATTVEIKSGFIDVARNEVFICVEV